MEAGSRNEMLAGCRKFAGNMLAHMAQLQSGRRIILQLAGNLAGVTANAFSRIKNDQRFHNMECGRPARSFSRILIQFKFASQAGETPALPGANQIFVRRQPKPLYWGAIKSQYEGTIVLIGCPELSG